MDDLMIWVGYRCVYGSLGVYDVTLKGKGHVWFQRL